MDDTREKNHISAQPKIIFLTGAPSTQELDWSDEALLAAVLPAREVSSLFSSISSGPFSLPRWRSVRQHELVKPEDSVTIDHHEDQLFLDHTITLLDSIIVSQLQLEALAGEHDEMTESFYSALSDAENIGDTRRVLELPELPITDLRLVPSSDYIQQLQPGTITLNLIVGVISMKPMRTVQLRRMQKIMDLVELIVGDDTRAGFGITIWLEHTQDVDHLRSAVLSLRPGSLILCSNVALATYRGEVYGQSLNKRISKNSTRILKLYDIEVSGQHYASKVRRLKTWAERFLGVSDKVNVQEQQEQLPPETQD